jgi:hypothetical protein
VVDLRQPAEAVGAGAGRPGGGIGAEADREQAVATVEVDVVRAGRADSRRVRERGQAGGDPLLGTPEQPRDCARSAEEHGPFAGRPRRLLAAAAGLGDEQRLLLAEREPAWVVEAAHHDARGRCCDRGGRGRGQHKAGQRRDEEQTSAHWSSWFGVVAGRAVDRAATAERGVNRTLPSGASGVGDRGCVVVA